MPGQSTIALSVLPFHAVANPGANHQSAISITSKSNITLKNALPPQNLNICMTRQGVCREPAENQWCRMPLILVGIW